MIKFTRDSDLDQARDTAKMKAAITYLRRELLPIFRPAPSQLKIGHVSFYPDTGTIVIDGMKREPRGGLLELSIILERELFRHLEPPD